LKLLNDCWMFLHAFYLLDIVEATRSWIQGHRWEVQHPCSLELSWPCMHQPSTCAFVLWKQVLTKALSLGQNLSLSQPLGPWLPSTTESGWYYNPAQLSLWHWQPQGWVCHGGIPTCLRQKQFHIIGQLDHLITPSHLLEWAQTMTYPDRLWSNIIS